MLFINVGSCTYPLCRRLAEVCDTVGFESNFNGFIADGGFFIALVVVLNILAPPCNVAVLTPSVTSLTYGDGIAVVKSIFFPCTSSNIISNASFGSQFASNPFFKILIAFSSPFNCPPNAAHSHQKMACVCPMPCDFKNLNVSLASSVLWTICCLAYPKYTLK